MVSANMAPPSGIFIDETERGILVDVPDPELRKRVYKKLLEVAEHPLQVKPNTAGPYFRVVVPEALAIAAGVLREKKGSSRASKR